MYTRTYWEDVNSIKDICTSTIDPNLQLYYVSLMYIDVQRWTIITSTKEKGARIVALTRSLYLLSMTPSIIRWSRCAAGFSSTAGSMPRRTGPRRPT
jgi:hypothetical protein